MDAGYLQLIKRLVERLERLSADSTYAHHASGLRGSLLRNIGHIEDGIEVSFTELDQLVEYGFEILRQAAREIGAKR